jgi:hypothetical protein
MPDLYRIQFIMTGQGQGWSESYVIPLDNATVATVGTQVANPLALSRGALLAREYKLQAYRVSKIRLAIGTVVKRNSDLTVVNYGPGGTTVAWRGCQPNECVIGNGVSADGGREKKVFHRGIPDQVIEDGGLLNAAETIGWFSKLASFQSLLLQAQAGWLQDVALGNVFNISGYVLDAGFVATITFTGAIFNGVAVGTRVPIRVTGVNGKSAINGLQMVVVLTDTTCETVETPALYPYAFGGSGQRMTDPKPFISAAAWGAELARTHQTGKVSVSTRGRAPARPRG